MAAETIDMFGAVPQPRLVRKEARSVYSAVLHLRRHGLKVYRAGAHHHVIDGERLTDEQIIARAETVWGWDKFWGRP